MNTPTVIVLVNNVALLLALGLLYDMVAYRSRGEKFTFKQLAIGVAVGLIGIMVMLTPWKFSSGVVFDTRSVLLSVSGLFFGTFSTLFAALITSAFRLYNGGTGAWAGVAVIFTSGIIGVLWRHLRPKGKGNISVGELYVMGIVVHVNMLLWLLTLPEALLLNIFSQMAVPVMTIFPVSTALLGWLLLNREKRKRVEDALRENELLLLTIAENLPNAYLAIIEKDFTIGFTSGQELANQTIDPRQFVGLNLGHVYGDKTPFVKDHYEKTFAGEERSFEFFNNGQHQYFRTVPMYGKDRSIPRILVVVENITARKEAEGKIQQQLQAQEALLNASTAISSTLDRESVLSRIVEEMGKVIDSTSAYFNIYDSEKNITTVIAEYISPNANELERESDLGKVYLEDDDIAYLEPFQTGQHDIAHIEDSDLTNYEKNEMQKYGVRTILYIPLLIRDQLVGYTEIWETRFHREYTPEEITLCHVLAQQAAVALENARSFERVQSAAHELKMLFNASQMLRTELLEVETIAKNIARLFVEMLPTFSSMYYFSACEISLFNPEEKTLQTIGVIFLEDDLKTITEGPIGEVCSCKEYPVTLRALETLQPLAVHVSDPEIDPMELKYMEDHEMLTVITLPLTVKGEAIGIIELESYQQKADLTQDEINLAMTIANQAAIAIENAQVFEQLQSQLAEIKELEGSLREQAIRDPLTGQFNRRYMDDILKRELARAARKGESLSIVILDLDHLKRINDNYGHISGGDVALKLFANTLKKMCREEDTLCRYAGDEFLIILYDTPLEVAKERAVQWRKSLKKIPSNQRFGLTFSAGVATFPDHGSASEEILIQADRALYSAKKQGRDQIVAYGIDIQKHWQDKDA